MKNQYAREYDRNQRRRQRESETLAQRHHRHTVNARTIILAATCTGLLALAAVLVSRI